MTTTNIRYVDPNAEVGGDGTTNALTGANCAYKSLAIWEAARQADLVSGDIIEKVICSSDDAGSTHAADTTGCTIDGWTTDATRYIQIEAASSHGGKWDDTIYRCSIAKDAGGNPFDIQELFVRIHGIQMIRYGHWGGRQFVNVGNIGSNCLIVIDKCIMRCSFSAASSEHDGVYMDIWGGSGNVVNITNCLFYDFKQGTETHTAVKRGVKGTVNVLNCTFHNCYIGVAQAIGTWNVKNCGFASCNTAISGTVDETTNSTDTPTFVDADNDDFHLAAGDTTWKNAGTDLSATFTTDIDGETRPTGAGTWDIGCDEYVSATVLWLPQFARPQYHPSFGGLTYG